tara:strand:+ start:729 stop:1010 length:282 start_codon:yes stop_codon:yes gene_type:complete
MKLTKETLKQIIKEELEAVMEGEPELPAHGVKTYISPRQKAYNEKMKRLLNHPHPKIRELASSHKPDGTPKTRKEEVADRNMAESLADALGDY